MVSIDDTENFQDTVFSYGYTRVSVISVASQITSPMYPTLSGADDKSDTFQSYNYTMVYDDNKCTF